jgi:hypothetical protein
MKMHGGYAHELIEGCGRSLNGLKFELEMKFEFIWKMKSHKIRILELVSDKIEVKDSKRKVVHICFSCLMKKTELDWGLLWWAAIVGFESLIAGHEELVGEGVEGEERIGAGGAGGYGGGEREGGMLGELRGCYSVQSLLLCVRKKAGNRRERRKEEEKEKMGKISKLGNFPKEKNNLWSWSKIIFVKERYMPNYN